MLSIITRQSLHQNRIELDRIGSDICLMMPCGSFWEIIWIKSSLFRRWMD